MAGIGPGSGWRALRRCWLAVGLLLGAGAGVLQWLGPPERPALAAMAPTAAPTAPPPPMAAPSAEPAPAAPEPVTRPVATPSAAEPSNVTPAATSPAAPPAASPAGSTASGLAALPPPGPGGAAPNPDAALAATSAAPEPAPLAAAIPRGPPQPGRVIPAADPALLEPGPHGPLPRISGEGRTAIRTYGRPFDRQDPRSRLGLIIGGLGMNAAVSEEAIARLPGPVALAFSPYVPQLPLLLDQARRKGMELLVALPLEPTGYPLNNPGDRALLTGNTESQNQDRLDWALSRFTGYVGAIGALGSMRGERFAALGDRLLGLQDQLRSRGLLYVDPRPGARAPERGWGRAIDLVVDEPATRGEIALKLQALERIAQERGSAVGYAGNASPVVIDRLAAWAGSVEARGFVLAPISALRRAPDVATVAEPPPTAPVAQPVRTAAP